MLYYKSAGELYNEPEIPYIQKELSGILEVEIEKLPAVYRTLVSLYHQHDLSYDKMAQITGLPEGTVKSYLFRARKKLKENLLSKYKKEAL
jgi:RNA polymerase sigma factor (sigma-70 family)